MCAVVYIRSIEQLKEELEKRRYHYFLSLLRSKSILDRLAALGGLEIAGFVFEEKVIHKILCEGIEDGDRAEA